MATNSGEWEQSNRAPEYTGMPPQSEPAHAEASQPGSRTSTPQPVPQRQSSQQARRLISVANELLSLAAELEDATAQSGDDHDEAFPVSPEDDARWLRVARRHYRDRRTRGMLFGDEGLFGEPAWDLLLDLFIAAKERKRVPVTSACIGAAVPTTTALRWLALLEDRGLIVREADASDARRIFVRLTADAYSKMIAYFVRAASAEADDTLASARANGRALQGVRR